MEEKTEKRWEGSYTVVGYNPKSKGYKLLDTTFALLKLEIPISHLKVIGKRYKENKVGEIAVMKI
jgi:hypothetical protein